MSHGFREYYPKISSKTIKFAPPMWVRYDSVVTPLFCRQRLYIQQMYSTLTDNRQNGQKQIGQIHLFNLLLPIDFILVDNIGQIINPNLWLLICPPILVAGLFCLPNLFNIHQKHHLFTKTKQIFCIFPPFYLHIWKISRIFAEKIIIWRYARN